MLLSVGPVLAAGWARREFRPNGLVVALTAVTMWTALGGTAVALAAAAVGRSHSDDQRAPFVLIRVPRGGDVRKEPRRRGFAVRRGGTFPGLGPDRLGIAVRPRLPRPARRRCSKPPLTRMPSPPHAPLAKACREQSSLAQATPASRRKRANQALSQLRVDNID